MASASALPAPTSKTAFAARLALVPKLVRAVLRLTEATIGRLFDQASESVRVLRLEMSNSPTLVQLEAVLRVLIDGGLLVLTIPKALEPIARDLLRQVAGFGPNAAREKRPIDYMAIGGGSPRSHHNARRRAPRRTTVDIYVRKGEPQPTFLRAKPAMTVQRRLAIRYQGSKLPLVGKTLPFLLPQLRPGDVVVSPFAGSLNEEAELASRGYFVKASDRDAALIEMWSVIQQRRAEFERAAIALLAEKDASANVRGLFYFWREKKFPSLTDPVERAAMSFAIRRMAALGSSLGAFAWGNRFTDRSIKHIAEFPLARIALDAVDFREAIDRAAKDDPLLLDPPYLGTENLYGGAEWDAGDYLDLLDRIKDRSRWLLHMNSCTDALALFAGFPMVEIEVIYPASRLIGKELIILPRGFAL